MAAASTRTVELPPLSFRASVATVNEEKRTVDLVFSTGAAVDRFDYWSGKRYIEKLSMKAGHVRLDRLNAGASLLDSHSAYRIGNVFGAVEPGTARLEKGQGVATVRFSRRADVEPIWQDVRDGILRFVSVGYRVHKFEEDNTGTTPVRTAVDWEPYEISLVAMPADAGAKVRGEEPPATFPCVIVAARSDADLLLMHRYNQLAQARS
jgi:hypothetical protein